MGSARISASLWTTLFFCSFSIMMRVLPWRASNRWRYLLWPSPMLLVITFFSMLACTGCRDIHCVRSWITTSVPQRSLLRTAIIERRAAELRPITLLHTQEATFRHAKRVIYSTPPVSVLDDLHDDGSLYVNISRFRRSYEVMEQVFRVYVYKEGRKPFVHEGPKTGIYASEGHFIELMETSRLYLTEDPEAALMFFIPFSVKKLVDFIYNPKASHSSMLTIQEFVANYVNSLSKKYPYMNRTQGTNHFFVSCHDWALRAGKLHDQLQKNVVKVVCNADPTRGFDVDRDVSLPETRIHYTRDGSWRLPLPGTNARPFLAFFAGQLHGKLRPVLLKHWKDKDPMMKIYGVLPKGNTSYFQYMRLSKYCICAAGFEVNSPRLVEAIENECVPVIIADNFVPPFSKVINWSSIAITVAEKDVPELKQILSSIPHERYIAMQNRLKYVKRHFKWNNPPVRFDIFNMIVHSIWSQRLRRFSSPKDEDRDEA